MGITMPAVSKVWMAIVVFVCAKSIAEEPMRPLIEFQSRPLTPALVLDEVSEPIHQIRLVVDRKLASGTLVLDGNSPQFDEFGNLVGGLQTPHVRGKGDPRLISELRCTMDLLKQGSAKWHVYQIQCSKLGNRIRLATKGDLASGSSARFLVLTPDDQIFAVIKCTRYGLVVP